MLFIFIVHLPKSYIALLSVLGRCLVVQTLGKETCGETSLRKSQNPQMDTNIYASGNVTVHESAK